MDKHNFNDIDYNSAYASDKMITPFECNLEKLSTTSQRLDIKITSRAIHLPTIKVPIILSEI
jgi:hypothetical protein